MHFWIPYAFVRIVVFFIVGILIGIFFPVNVSVIAAITCCGLVTALYFLLVLRYKTNPTRINPGYVGLLSVLLAGYGNVQLRNESTRADHIINLSEKIVAYKAVVVGYPEEKSKSWKLEARLTDVRTESGWQHASAKVMLYFSKETMLSAHYGDVLIIGGTPQPVNGPLNPGEFDYSKFLASRNIYHQQFLKGDNDIRIDHAPPRLLMKYAFLARAWADHTLESFVSGDRERGIASALVLGITDGLDPDIMSAYGATGTLHVLAVSGLHISIIYLILSWILTPLNRTLKGKWIVAIISLIVLWAYAYVTGLSPSVLRSVTMFSFVALAKPWKQKINIYNTLSASAFLLLLFDPQLILSVGFQLSYIAVLGIVYLQPKLYQAWEPKSRVWDEIWKVTSVSIAAQVATLPLTLFYFHQFPNYFLFSNLLVIPASFVVLIGGLLVLLFSFIPIIAATVGWIITWTAKLMNAIVVFFEFAPGSQIQNIYLTIAETILLALIIIACLLLLERKEFAYVVAASILVTFFVASRWWNYSDIMSRDRLIVYNVPGHTAIDFIADHRASLATDSSFNKNDQLLRFHVKPARLMYGVRAIGNTDAFEQNIPEGKFLRWKNKTVLLLNQELASVKEELRVDYLVIGNNAFPSVDQVRRIKADVIIIDSSNKYYLADRWMKKFLQLEPSKRLHSILHQGTYEEKFDL